MLIAKDADPIDVRAGIYKHYKGELYNVRGYSQDASNGNNLQIAYTPLYINPDHTGARDTTRDWREFFATVCVMHRGVDIYAEEELHLKLMQRDVTEQCGRGWHMERFQYMGPIYYKGFES